MNTAIEDLDTEPWYRQFWPWFLIAVPALTVLACMVTIYIALSYPHRLVVDDYTKMDAINQAKFAAISTARVRRLNADMTLDRATGVVSLRLRESAEPSTGAGTLELVLAHPSRPADDKALALTEIDAGVYRGQLTGVLTDSRYVELRPVDVSSGKAWRLAGELAAAAGVAYLTPQ